jgi:hypothetical protein
MKDCFRMVACMVTGITLTAIAVRAGERPIDLASLANEPWTFQGPNDFLIINGSTFPTGVRNFGGIPFVIPASPNNYWAGGAAADFGPGTVSLTIPVGVFGVTSVFTVMNSMWGWAGPDAYLFLTFHGSAGATETVPLVGNVNVRDYNKDGNTNSINNTSTIEVWDNGLGQRLDRQEYILPEAFLGQTLTSITLTDTGNEGNGTNGSRAVLAALTVSTCSAVPTENITTTSGEIVYEPSVKLYAQDISLTNTGSAAVNGPLFFILEDLPSGVGLGSKSGNTACLSPLGSGYVTPLPAGSLLAPNTSLHFRLLFSDPSGAAITYTPLLAGSDGATP